MTDSGDDEFHNGYEPVVRERWERALNAKEAIRSNQPNPSAELKLRAANHIASFYDVLSRHADEDALDTPWEEREVNVDIIDRYFDETVALQEPANRRGNVTKERRVPKVATLTAPQLKQIVNELDQIAKELGFASPVEGSTHRTEITDELIDEVEEWRQQNLD